MAQATVQANVKLPGDVARGDSWQTEVDDYLLRRAASGQVSILSTDADQGQDPDHVDQPPVSQQNIDEVLTWVGADPGRARIAALAERQRSESEQRSTLLAQLDDVAGSY